jgi:hypothetical protein
MMSLLTTFAMSGVQGDRQPERHASDAPLLLNLIKLATCVVRAKENGAYDGNGFISAESDNGLWITYIP